jgi:hypothetical protein
MKDYVLNKKPEPAANETVWAFDLGNVPRPSDGCGWRAATGEGCDWPDDFPSPRWGDLSRLGNGERSSAEPKARSGPSERARVSQRGRSPDEVNTIPPISAQGFPAHPGGICLAPWERVLRLPSAASVQGSPTGRDQNRRRSPPEDLNPKPRMKPRNTPNTRKKKG